VLQSALLATEALITRPQRHSFPPGAYIIGKVLREAEKQNIRGLHALDTLKKISPAFEADFRKVWALTQRSRQNKFQAARRQKVSATPSRIWKDVSIKAANRAKS